MRPAKQLASGGCPERFFAPSDDRAVEVHGIIIPESRSERALHNTLAPRASPEQNTAVVERVGPGRSCRPAPPEDGRFGACNVLTLKWCWIPVAGAHRGAGRQQCRDESCPP